MESASLPLIAFMAFDRGRDYEHYKSTVTVTMCHLSLSHGRRTENINDP